MFHRRDKKQNNEERICLGKQVFYSELKAESSAWYRIFHGQQIRSRNFVKNKALVANINKQFITRTFDDVTTTWIGEKKNLKISFDSGKFQICSLFPVVFTVFFKFEIKISPFNTFTCFLSHSLMNKFNFQSIKLATRQLKTLRTERWLFYEWISFSHWSQSSLNKRVTYTSELSDRRSRENSTFS